MPELQLYKAGVRSAYSMHLNITSIINHTCSVIPLLPQTFMLKKKTCIGVGSFSMNTAPLKLSAVGKLFLVRLKHCSVQFR